MEYVKPTILTTMQACSVIAVGVTGCNPLIKAKTPVIKLSIDRPAAPIRLMNEDAASSSFP